jgi:hypothetical protein
MNPANYPADLADRLFALEMGGAGRGTDAAILR